MKTRFLVASGGRARAASLLAGCLVFLLLASLGCLSRPKPTAMEHYHRGLYFENRRQPWDAIIEYRLALDQDPKNTALRLRLADLLFDTGDRVSAERNYNAIIKMEPGNAKAVNNLAWLYTVTGYHLDWAEKALKPIVEQPSPYRHVYLDTLGVVLQKRSKNREALEAFKKADELCGKGEVQSTPRECDQINQHLRSVEAAD
jgi:tetratricopeptide (TPR) repeat protein